MPELPEVETIKNALFGNILQRKFTEIEIFIEVCRYPLRPLLEPSLLNQKIIDVRRRARYLIIELENHWSLTIHFGMSGSMRIVPPGEPRKKHEHVVFHLDNGRTMRFDCPRRFGFIRTEILPTTGADPDKLKELGVEPLSNAFSGNYLKGQFSGRSAKIKNAIMDNRIVVGIGNIYANESLFLSGIHPLTQAGKLSVRDCCRLVNNTKATLEKAIAAGGTTISDFKGVDGSEGKFVQQLQVYGKNFEPCPVCGTAIKREVIGGRSSFYCSKCQKLKK